MFMVFGKDMTILAEDINNEGKVIVSLKYFFEAIHWLQTDI